MPSVYQVNLIENIFDIYYEEDMTVFKFLRRKKIERWPDNQHC